MKISKFTEEQIIAILREQKTGAKTADVIRNAPPIPNSGQFLSSNGLGVSRVASNRDDPPPDAEYVALISAGHAALYFALAENTPHNLCI